MTQILDEDNIKNVIKNNEFYLEDAKLNSVFIYQRRVFHLQALKLHELLERQNIILSLSSKSNSTNPNSNLNDILNIDNSNILNKRHSQKDILGNKRIVDDVEMALLSILDSDGILSLSYRVSEFIVLMTKITKVDHRSLCLNILSKLISTTCGHQFVTQGGLRLLKRWLKIAEEDDNINELCSILIALRKLPFDSQVVKETEIGKAVKKLLKYKSPSKLKDNLPLYDEVKNLIKYWTDQLTIVANNKSTGASLNNSNNISDMPPLVVKISEQFYKDKGVPKDCSNLLMKLKIKKEIEIEDEKKNNEDTSMSISSSDNKPSTIPATIIQTESTPISEQTIAKIIPKVPIRTVSSLLSSSSSNSSSNVIPPRVVSMAPISSEPRGVGSQSIADIVAAATTLSSSKSGSTFGPSLTTSNITMGGITSTGIRNSGDIKALPTRSPLGLRERRSSDMAKEARKLLANEALRNARLEGNTFTNDENVIEQKQVKIKQGCLKRRSDGSSSDYSNKRPKVKVQWADESGGSLRDVFTFEVENNFKRSTYDFTHRDLMKKEKLLEKETHLSHKLEAMQKTIDWKKPLGLLLPLEVQDNCQNPIDSVELEVQTNRLMHVLEARYQDELLIPLDPDEPSKSESDMPIMNSSDAIVIPWQDNFPNDQLISNNNLKENNNNNNNNNLFSFLPPILQNNLDDDILNMILQDNSIIPSLLNTDGSINYSTVLHLRNMQSLYSNPNNNLGPQFIAPPSLPPNQFNPGHPNNVAYNPVSNNPFDPTEQYDPTNQFNPNENRPSRFTTNAPNNQIFAPPPPFGGLANVNQFVPASAPPSSNQNKKFTSTKAQTACKYFSTPRGCQFGSKCTFAHNEANKIHPPTASNNLDIYGPPPGSNIRTGPGRRR
jgi:hypothetical protein